jgi:hypothetical protein
MNIAARILGSVVCAWGVYAQTTQGVISLQLTDSVTGLPVTGAELRYSNLNTGVSSVLTCARDGVCLLPLASPGEYNLRVTAKGYQARSLQQLNLPVAGRLDLDLRLRPLADVWEAGQYRSVFDNSTGTVVTFFGPDVDTSRSESFRLAEKRQGALDTSASYVIDTSLVRDLPLSNRDLYAMLLVLPGVTAYNGTGRGLGLTVNGQRASSSSYLLDGADNNSQLVTGPQTVVAPEAAQEYRVSTNNFSAEYGRTSGFVTNAITRGVSPQWHGLAYYYLKNEGLNANGFQQNRLGVDRLPFKENQTGFSVAGPVWRQRLHASLAYEYLRLRSRGDAGTVVLPTSSFVNGLATGSPAGRLLRQYRPETAPAGSGALGEVVVAQDVMQNRHLVTPRLDYSSQGGGHRLFARLAVAQSQQPEFIYSPYPDFRSTLRQGAVNLALGAVDQISTNVTNEARFARNGDVLRLDRPHPEVATFGSFDQAWLPGSPLFYDYRNSGRNYEVLDNVVVASGRHLYKFGGGMLWRQSQGPFTFRGDGFYFVESVHKLASSEPLALLLSYDRTNPATAPEYDRRYRSSQGYFFLQDSFRLRPNLTLNYGLRYERYGAPVNVGSGKDLLVRLGSGQSLPARIASAKYESGSGDQPIYDQNGGNWNARFGFSYLPSWTRGTVIRGAWGMYHDRPYDNLFQPVRTNNLQLGSSFFEGPVDFTLPARQVARLTPPTDLQAVADPLLFQPGVRDPRVQSWFLGMQRPFGDGLTLEMNYLGSAGRQLLTTDRINRAGSVPLVPVVNNSGRYNPQLDQLAYRGSQGKSAYNALAMVMRYRVRRVTAQVAYTWSHSIDLQSDPLAGEFQSFNFAGAASGGADRVVAAFSRQFDSQADRGSSDFDQRHNFVFYAVAELPRLWANRPAGVVFREWKVASLGAVRSGFPYNPSALDVFDQNAPTILNNRPNLVAGENPALDVAVAGGRRLLNEAAFGRPNAGQLGNVGRNSFTGPGLWNVDFSLSRRIPVRRWLESSAFVVRADFFNVFNHANLNNPDNAFVGVGDSFAVARYGRSERNTGFPLLTPLAESPRTIQMMVRFEF